MILYYEMCQILLKNTTAILFEMWPLLQIATILLQNATFITNRDSTMSQPVLLTDFISSIK